MSSDKNGISVYKNKNKYNITIGGTRPQGRGEPLMMPGFSAIPSAGYSVISTSFNPTFYAYGMYSSTGSTRIKCLFDEEFNHIVGEIEDNIFDRIEDYKESIDRFKTESITYIDKKVILGYWNPNQEKYIFMSFE